jgi:hypothetical protein
MRPLRSDLRSGHGAVNPSDIPGLHDMGGNGPVWGLVAALLTAGFIGAYVALTKIVAPLLQAMLNAIKEMSEAVNKNSRYLRRLMGYMQGKTDALDDDESDEPQQKR